MRYFAALFTTGQRLPDRLLAIDEILDEITASRGLIPVADVVEGPPGLWTCYRAHDPYRPAGTPYRYRLETQIELSPDLTYLIYSRERGT